MNLTQDIIATAASTGLSAVIFAPFEMASTQSKVPNAKIRGLSLMSHICKEQGFFKLWKGSQWFTIAYGSSKFIWFLSYDAIKYSLNQNSWAKSNQNYVNLLAGLISGATVATVSNPLWAIKTQAQLDNYKGIRETPGLLTRKGLMGGTIPSSAYVAIESAGQMVCREILIKYHKKYFDKTPDPIVGGLIGMISRVVILPVTYPLHVLTLRYRINALKESNKESFTQIIKSIHTEKAYYAGLSPYTIRVGFQSLVLFFLYETFKKNSQ